MLEGARPDPPIQGEATYFILGTGTWRMVRSCCATLKAATTDRRPSEVLRWIGPRRASPVVSASNPELLKAWFARPAT